MQIQLEGLWRPKIEILPASVCLTSAAVIILNPDIFLLSPEAAIVIGCGIAALGLWRLWQFSDLWQRQSNLLKQPDFILDSKDIPVSDKTLFLGNGFLWERKHAQRLFDVRTYASAYLQASPLTRLRNKLSPPPELGGEPWIHGIETCEVPVTMNLSERVGHTLVVGTTGVGKTRLAETLITQDIRRADDVVIILDPKGDLDLLKRVCIEAKNCGREDQLYIFHLGFPEVSARYNPLGDFTRMTEVASRVAAQLPDGGQSSAFKNFAWRYVNVITKAMLAIGKRPSYDQLKKAAENLDPLLIAYYEFFLNKTKPDWKAEYKIYISCLKDPENKECFVPREMKGRDINACALVLYVQYLADNNNISKEDEVINALESVLKYDRSYFDKLVASLLPFLDKVTSGRINEILSPKYGDANDKRPTISFSQIINQRGILYVGLDTLTDPEVGSAVGYAMFSDLKSTAGQIYKEGQEAGLPEKHRRKKGNIIVHADEMSEIAGSEVTGLLNKGRGAGFQLTLYTQTVDDAEVKLGTAAAARQFIGNLNNLIMLRVREAKTAELLTKGLPEVELATVATSSAASSKGDNGNFDVRVEDKVTMRKVPLLAPSDMLNLPKGSAFAFIEGGHLWKIRMPLIKETDPDMAKKEVRTLMAKANGIN